jgi:stage V sporulation protein R
MTLTTGTRLNRRPLFDGPEWDFDLLQRVYNVIEEIGVGELGLDIYPNQIEVITAEQMLDAYASIGMPHMYRHWSFGKHFAREESLYRKGARILAYELVINSNP